MTEPSRTTHIGLARYAREYFDAALAADDVIGERKGYEISAPPPVMFLVAHAIELALKSYLLHSGLELSEIIRLGHNLIDLWQKAAENNVEDILKLSDEDLNLLGLLSDLHESTELRYIRTGFKQFPVFGPLQTMASKILNAICPHVGYR